VLNRTNSLITHYRNGSDGSLTRRARDGFLRWHWHLASASLALAKRQCHPGEVIMIECPPALSMPGRLNRQYDRPRGQRSSAPCGASLAWWQAPTNGSSARLL